MYIIVGLGNPKTEYKNTMHNIGFDVIDVLAEKYNIVTEIRKHKAFCGKGFIGSEKAVLAMPQTYMNLSGDSVREIVDYYKIDVEKELIVIYDDIDLDVGQLRIRKKGSAGGHNGMKSIIGQLGTEDFTRIRMGVGAKPKGYDLADYVLGHFSKEEQVLMDEGYAHAIHAVEMILEGDISAAMNEYNRKRRKSKRECIVVTAKGTGGL